MSDCIKCGAELDEMHQYCPACHTDRDKSELSPAPGSASEDDNYWLLRSLAQYVCDLNIACEREPCSCDQSSLCITEWCEPCAAKAWLESEQEKEKPVAQTPNVEASEPPTRGVASTERAHGGSLR